MSTAPLDTWILPERNCPNDQEITVSSELVEDTCPHKFLKLSREGSSLLPMNSEVLKQIDREIDPTSSQQSRDKVNSKQQLNRSPIQFASCFFRTAY